MHEIWQHIGGVCVNELALFAGAGGGVLGGHLLGWRTICAVEWEPYAASVLVARQNDGILPPFPVWDDVQTFDGLPWRGRVDVISGGFPCQDISVAGGGQALMENEAVCGGKWPESSVRYDPSSCLWKTAHCLWDEDLPWSSVTLPRWGMTRSGSVFQHPTAVRPISGTASGFWPTPTATDWKGSPSLRVVNQRSEGSSRGVRLPEHLSKLDQVEVGGNLNPTWSEWLMGWPPGWTDLGPLAMDKFLVWRRQHSACSDRDGGIKEAA